MNSTWLFGKQTALLVLIIGAIIVVGCDYSSLLSTSLGTAFVTSSQPRTAAIVEDETKEKKELPPATDLVKDWDKPDVTLFITGRLNGYIEPCGCTGLENQKGGLMRRHTVQKILEERGWNLVSIDAGNQVRRFGQQPVIKLQKTYETLCRIMNYDVAAFGPDDLKLNTVDMLQSIMNSRANDRPESNPFTCANVILFGDSEQTNAFRVIERNGKRVGVTTILGDDHAESLRSQTDLQLVAMRDGLKKVVPQLLQQRCDMLVLVSHTAKEETSIALAKEFPVFDLLITTSGAGDPTYMPQQIRQGNHVTQMIQVGKKGMYVGLVGLYTGAQGKRIKYERVSLDHRYKDSKEMRKLFVRYQKELENLYVTGNNQDIRPRQHPSGNKFVGSQACFECHDEEFDIWAEGVDGGGEGPHFRATLDLTNPPNDRGDIPRHFDPECLSCHVTGWHPQNFYPYETGFINLKKDDLLHGNGCENCHGPGSGHIEAEQADDNAAKIKAMREAVRLTKEEAAARACRQCHDIDNSPDFNKDGAFDEYWEQIKHGENN